MARNGSGTYSLPAGNPVVTGTIISSTVHNNTMSDIATELTNSVDKDGQTVITGSIDYNGNALILDADGDSKLEVSTDDRFDVTLGAVLSLSLTSAEALKLDAISALAVTDGNIIVGNGTTWVAESGSTARQSLGVDLTTKGTLLAGNGTAPATVSAGTNGHVLTANSSVAAGVEFAAIPDTARDYQAFTSSGTWTAPAGAEFVLVQAWGGGGGGANNTASSTAESGGSGGEYVWQIFRASDLGATETVTIGAGGSGAANGATADGSTGGTTTFGTHLSAIGGNPGKTGAGTTYITIPRSTATTSAISGSAYGILITTQAGPGSTAAGGKTIYGGGGGGGSDTGGSTGGTSEIGGDGGGGNNTLNTPGTAGSAPAGGGGGSGNNGGGGAGARGEARVWTW